jgi:predicted O-methyltransferase YrrM
MVTPAGFPGLLEEIYIGRGGPPAVSRETANALAVLLTLHKPRTALEIGCSYGFSACLTAYYMAEGGTVTTVERNAALFDTARANFAKMGHGGRITLVEGDANDVLPRLCGQNLSYDYIFIDAAKGQYVNFLPYCMEMLRDGGLMVADNVFNKGFTAGEREAVPKRQRTAHMRMREFLRMITNDGRLRSAVLGVGDGLSVSVKIK